MTSTEPQPDTRPGPRVTLAALWTTTMLIVAFVDIFSLYRPDVREQIAEGTLFIFAINGGFLLGILLYVTVPTLMITLSVVAPRRINRVAQCVVAPLFGVTIIGAAVGEWAYYVVASGIELVLLAAIVTVAARWHVGTPERVSDARETQGARS